MASLCYLNPHLEAIHAKAEMLDVPTPVVDSLRDLLHSKLPACENPICASHTVAYIALNTPKTSYTSIRPLHIIDTLTHTNPDPLLNNANFSFTNSLMTSREHQDAQELFQLISECIKNESAAVDREHSRDRGLGFALTSLYDSDEDEEADARKMEKCHPSSDFRVSAASGSGKSTSPFDGLTANRRSCMECGYTEAVMHFSFDNWQLAVPRMKV